MKVGVEVEYWVINCDGQLVSSKDIAEHLDFAEQEFVEPLLEIKTQPYENVQDVREELNYKVSKVLETAESLGVKICPLGTPLNSDKVERLSSRRGSIQQEIIGDNLEAAKRVAGTHIHFEKENVKNQLNILTALDPALALMNSSPYYQGENLASSSRNQVYRYECYKNFPRHGQLWKYTDSIQEWEKRIEESFEEFKAAGKHQDISSEEIEKYFRPSNALWTPVRLRKDFPTVEWRALDTGKPEKIIKLLKQTKKIVENASRNNEIDLPEFSNVEKLSKKAIHQGLQSEEVKTLCKRVRI